MRKTIAGLVAMLAPVGAVAQPAECQVFQNAIIVSEEGEYLGKLASKYDQDSIFNKYGTHGSRYSSESIWNKYGDYGSRYASESAFNEHTSTPPLIVKDGKVIARLTKNEHLAGAVDPMMLAIICFDYEQD